ACSGDSTAVTDPTTRPPSSSPPTTSTPPTTPTKTTPSGRQPPVLPTLAKEKSLAGARAFTRFYIQAINYSWHARSGELLRQYSTADCIACRGLAGSMDNIKRDGGFSHGGDWIVTSASPVPLQTMIRPIIQIGVTVQPGEWK